MLLAMTIHAMGEAFVFWQILGLASHVTAILDTQVGVITSHFLPVTFCKVDANPEILKK